MARPNLLRLGFSSVRALRVDRPRQAGSATVTHEGLSPILLALGGSGGLGNVDRSDLESYLNALDDVDPQSLTPGHALAFWINLYNSLVIRLAVDTRDRSASSVLEIRSAFDRPVVTIGRENLSLLDIETGKIRRFGDPRIHGSLVCGSLSCPTLRPEPFDGARVAEQLDAQMRSFLRSGAAIVDRTTGRLSLSRIFLWYGSDFVRPHRMPAFIPSSKARIATAVATWLDADDRAWFESTSPIVNFQSYDWGLGCVVA